MTKYESQRAVLRIANGAGIILIALMLLISAFAFSGSQTFYTVHKTQPKFIHAPQDLPVLNTPQAVWTAEARGVSVFKFDGTTYIIDNLPMEYVKYSAKYVRMP